MKLKILSRRICAILMTAVLGMSPVTVYAETTDMQEHVLQGNNCIKVSVPASIDLSLNDDGDKFTGSGSVSVAYTDNENKVDTFRMIVDNGVTYTDSEGNSIKGNVTFGETGGVSWSVDEVKAQVAKAISVEADIPSVGGTFEGSIEYKIKVIEDDLFLDDEYYGTEKYFTYEMVNGGRAVNIIGLTGMGISWVGSSVNYIEGYDSPCVDKYTKDAGDLIVPSKFMIDGVLYDVKSVYGVGEHSNQITNAVVLDGGIKELVGSFEDCTNLQSVTLPDNLCYLGDNCFSNCSSLSSVVIPNGVTCVGRECFYGCANLEQLDIPNSVTGLGVGCFALSGLVELAIPESVESMMIGVTDEEYYGTFYNCKQLKKVSIPSTVTEIGKECFSQCSSLVDVQLPDNLEYLPYGCFMECTSLQALKVPDTMTRIEGYCFRGCSALQSFEIPDTVTRMDAGCFYNCSSLSEIVIPQGVSSLGNEYGLGAFENCTSLRKVALPDTMNELGFASFRSCTSLEEINFPKSLTTIDGCAFSRCSSLSDININGTDCTLSSNCFEFCSSLKNVVVSEGIISLGLECFQYCESLTNVSLAESVSFLDSHCFFNCGKLENINLSNVKELGSRCFSGCNNLLSCDLYNVTEIPYGCFEYCLNLRSVYCPNVVVVYKDAFSMHNFYNEYISSIELPKCKVIKENAFWSFKNLTSISIPAVETIEQWAFVNTNKLREIDLPLSVSSIGYEAFTSVRVVNYAGSETDRSFIDMSADNSLLESSVTWNYGKETADINWQDCYTWELDTDNNVAICKTVLKCGNHMEVPETVVFDENRYTVVELGNNLFENQTYLEAIVLPDTISKIGESCFKGTSLSEFTFPESLTHIGSGCFSDTQLVNVVIPDNVTFVGDGIFYNCLYLESVSFSNNITEIGEAVCSGCKALRSVTLPSNLNSLGVAVSDAYFWNRGAFYNCWELTEVAFPESLTIIGASAFYGCSKLVNVYLPDNVKEIGSSVFSGCSGLESIHLPSSLENIPTWMFYGCSSLSSVDGFSHVRKIGDHAFRDCSFTNCDFSNIDEIGEKAFWNSAITEFVASEKLKRIGDEAFIHCVGLEYVDLSRYSGYMYGTFHDCSNLKTVKLSQELIDLYSFEGCNGIQDVYCNYTYAYRKEMITNDTIPLYATWHYGDIDVPLYRYFNWTSNTVCNGLKYDIANDKFEIPYAYTSDSGTPYSLTGFGADAFKGELRITNLDMPDSVKSIASGAFADCTNITEVHIPGTMEYIYDNAFSGCSAIQTVYYDGTKEQFDNSTLKAAWCEGNDALKNADWVFTDGAGSFSLRESETDLAEEEEVAETEESTAENGTEVQAAEAVSEEYESESSETEESSDEEAENGEEVSEVIIEEGGEDIPEESETEIPAVQIEAEVKDEDEEKSST